ncbi:MAG: hypothetical protein HY678_09185 [Chloroflexi bacterium]|nr:hypothetical protein [Chloroflexota bacterium]
MKLLPNIRVRPTPEADHDLDKSDLLRDLLDSYSVWLGELCEVLRGSPDVESVRRILTLWVDALDLAMTSTSTGEAMPIGEVRSLITGAAEAMREWPEPRHRTSLVRLWGILSRFETSTGSELAETAEECSRVVIDGAAKTVLIPTEVLVQCWCQILPPERMAVFAGRWDRGGSMRITAGYDVTGAASDLHVQADRKKLHRALVQMESTGCFLAGWMHSHPGVGPGGSIPSHLDTTQQRWFAANYGGFQFGLVATRDGFIRRLRTVDGEYGLKLTLEGCGLEQTERDLYRVDVGVIGAQSPERR